MQINPACKELKIAFIIENSADPYDISQAVIKKAMIGSFICDLFVCL